VSKAVTKLMVGVESGHGPPYATRACNSLKKAAHIVVLVPMWREPHPFAFCAVAALLFRHAAIV